MQKLTVIQYCMRMQRPLKVCTCERGEFCSFVISNKFCFPRHLNAIIYEFNAYLNE